jgi:hypothetical protein
MASDSRRLSILTAQEIDDLYGLPRFTEDDRRLYFDLSPMERELVCNEQQGLLIKRPLNLLRSFIVGTQEMRGASKPHLRARLFFFAVSLALSL